MQMRAGFTIETQDHRELGFVRRRLIPSIRRNGTYLQLLTQSTHWAHSKTDN